MTVEICVEAKLFRLTIFLSLLAFFGFGIPVFSAVSTGDFYHSQVLAFTNLKETNINQCRAGTRTDCDIKAWDPLIQEQIQNLVRTEKQGRELLTAALAIPFGLFLLFFGGRWVLTGKLKKAGPLLPPG